MADQPTARTVYPSYDNRGTAHWRTRMSPPDNSYAKLIMVPDRIIPVIFVPGVMGSNLKGTGRAKGTDWRLDSYTTMGGWLGRGAKRRKLALTPQTMALDDGGSLPEGTEQVAEELKRRGWGEVGAMSYAPFLVWLENALNDYNDPHQGERVKTIGKDLGASTGEEPLLREKVALSYKYRFPVHACGYNWLGSNAESAKHLAARINKVIARYKGEGKKCERVILVTHSMGGLVARCCSEVEGMRDKIFGVVHGVMPAIGAPAVYRRFKAGTEGDYIPSEVLGNDAAEMTAVLSSAPGPLELLPTPAYGNGWLKVHEFGVTRSLPEKGDPYAEIYAVRGKWWSMCDERLMNPLNKETDASKRTAQMNADWNQFDQLIKSVRSFHSRIEHRYHSTSFAFYGSDEAYRAYGNVMWLHASRTPNAGSSDFMEGEAADPTQIKRLRTVNVQAQSWPGARSQAPGQPGARVTVARDFTISDPDEPGDGTVPHRSGVAVQPYVHSLLKVKTGHEPAFKEGPDVERIRAFTLRAIVNIAQAVQGTGLKYED